MEKQAVAALEAAVNTQPSPQDAFIYARLVNLVRTGEALTRPALEQATGLGRKLVAQRVQQAMAVGLLEDGDFAPSGGGRAPRQLRFKADAGHVYAGLMGAGEIRAAVSDLDGAPVAAMHRDWDISEGPEATMDQLQDMFQRLAKRTKTQPWSIGVGVPGPVNFGTGQLVAPPIMPGWDGFSVRSWLRERYDAPVWVDNDVNLMALGEWHRGHPSDRRDLLYVKVGTGIGSGLVSGGSVYRGDTGAAGDIGHVKVSDDPGLNCRCGETGCLEAVTGGWGLVQQLTPVASSSPYLSSRLAERGKLTPEDIGIAASRGDSLASRAVVDGARTVGATVSSLVNFINPGVVVVGGGMLRSGEQAFEALAETVMRRSTKLATEKLTLRTASLDFQEGVVGASLMAVEQLFAQSALGLWIEQGSPLGQAANLHRLAAGH
ncbi:ROK family protein [Paenarthrobacter ilicis]|uniref:NBD/HSP70 family sugar kinase n=1 Tax=Paenarthrobacter ilicis TaxID=43665 RepID=A0ABX0TJZ6_9MICC|nr:putative NBD/HSP70 family sugar kinase [Paenarthrobacter ilicis]NIJ01461.1 putative NBD/HSP70 family sugar kinase [Paenarthrobacter ilicis]